MQDPNLKAVLWLLYIYYSDFTSVPGEKAIFFMKRMISFITLAISNFRDLLHSFLVEFVSKGGCVM